MNAPSKIRILLVDDHFVVRLGLMGSLNMEADMEVVGECGSGERALGLYEEMLPDITIMDGRLQGISGKARIRA